MRRQTMFAVLVLGTTVAAAEPKWEDVLAAHRQRASQLPALRLEMTVTRTVAATGGLDAIVADRHANLDKAELELVARGVPAERAAETADALRDSSTSAAKVALANREVRLARVLQVDFQAGRIRQDDTDLRDLKAVCAAAGITAAESARHRLDQTLSWIYVADSPHSYMLMPDHRTAVLAGSAPDFLVAEQVNLGLLTTQVGDGLEWKSEPLEHGSRWTGLRAAGDPQFVIDLRESAPWQVTRLEERSSDRKVTRLLTLGDYRRVGELDIPHQIVDEVVPGDGQRVREQRLVNSVDIPAALPGPFVPPSGWMLDNRITGQIERVE